MSEAPTCPRPAITGVGQGPLRRLQVTIGLIGAFLVVFMLEAGLAHGISARLGAGDPAALLLQGRMLPRGVDAGRWWQLVTAGFLHVGILHIAVNCAGLLIAGALLEARCTSSRFAWIFFAALVGGNLAAYLTTAPDVAICGASGAVMGLLSAVPVIAIEQRWSRGRLLLGAGIALPVIAAGLLYGLSHPGYSNAGHFGGLLSGLVAALLGPLGPARPAVAQPRTSASRGMAVGRAQG